MTYRPEEVDPNTVHIETGNDSAVDYMRGLGQLAQLKARVSGSHVLCRFAAEPETGEPSMHIKEIPPDVFQEDLFLQCPQAMDLEARTAAVGMAQRGLIDVEEVKVTPRLPSMLVKPSGDIVIAKPDLCDNCVHRVQRGAFGNCDGRQFEPLVEIIR